jgi:hypothetical protein
VKRKSFFSVLLLLQPYKKIKAGGNNWKGYNTLYCKNYSVPVSSFSVRLSEAVKYPRAADKQEGS